MTQDVAAQSAANDTRYCVMHLPCDPVLRGRKDRCGYSLAVLHFRKVVIWKKVGSARKDGAVIYFRGCMYAYYHISDFNVE
ncbi:hypothetical protein BWJ02_26975 [Salmonella enterica]|nr:hypothetical protein [Salmonella enterica]